MGAQGRDLHDEDNSSFDPEPVFEEPRPGLVTAKRSKRDTGDGDDQLTPHDREHIPQESLAERIRREVEGA